MPDSLDEDDDGCFLFLPFFIFLPPVAGGGVTSRSEFARAQCQVDR